MWPRLATRATDLSGVGGSALAVDAHVLMSDLEHPIAGQPVRSPDDLEARADKPTLTHREREVLQFAAEGHTTREISEQLCISHATVKTHLEHIYQKLGAHDRTAAVAKALREGIIR